MTDNNAVAVRIDVPITLHPDTVLPLADALDREDTDGRRAYGIARAALETMHGTYAAIEEAERAMRAAVPPDGEVRMEGGLPRLQINTEELAAAAGKAFDRAARDVDAKRGELIRIRDGLAARVAAAVADPQGRTPEGIALAAEIRAHVKALPEGERLGFLMDAVGRDDGRTVAAVLAGPTYLSGVDANQAGLVRAAGAARWNATATEQHAAVERAIERVTAAGGTLAERYGRIIAQRDAAKARAREALDALANGGRA